MRVEELVCRCPLWPAIDHDVDLAVGVLVTEVQVQEHLIEALVLCQVAENLLDAAYSFPEHLDLLVKDFEDVFLDGPLQEQVVNEDPVTFLAESLNAANSLFEPHGVPGEIEVDHRPGALEVEPF
jgi:hypothetical protein